MVNDSTGGFSIVPNHVVRGDMTAAEKLVYIALLNRANSRGESWPSVARLSVDASCGLAGVRNAVRVLAAKGLVAVEERRSDNGGLMTRLYRVEVWQPPYQNEEGPPIKFDSTPLSELKGEEYTLKNTQLRLTSQPRNDVIRLVKLLGDLVEENGSNRPVETRGNLDAIRLLIDKDGRSEHEITEVIRWCQRDEFWRSNILSAKKLRQQFDQLRLQMVRTGGSRSEQNLSVVEKFQQMERGQIDSF